MDANVRLKAQNLKKTKKYQKSEAKMRAYISKKLGEDAKLTGDEPYNVISKILKSKLITQDKMELMTEAYHSYFYFQLDKHARQDVKDSYSDIDFDKEFKEDADFALNVLYEETVTSFAINCIKRYVQDIRKLGREDDFDYVYDYLHSTKIMYNTALTFVKNIDETKDLKAQKELPKFKKLLNNTITGFKEVISEGYTLQDNGGGYKNSEPNYFM